ncbi:LuxR C-terminal-related transcriptional regulator [Pseudonocardia ailaonensis]|uniref:LuxR C-terminal-related transcriptional regulator n=1 Tax=Pseudonocardia ailaonensis TaxID=367279 RepID=A0ABN2NJR1_9PSEU
MGPLVTTKLHVPRRRRGQVPRPRLTRVLDAGESALTLVSAPAGFGKTTVLADWLAGRTGRTAWLSLDARDDDPATFWAYVHAALRAVVPALGAVVPGPAEADLATLVNDLAAVDDGLVLVLDDFHLVGSPAVQEGVGFLVEHLPPQVRLVLATRADPALPLARWRSRGDLVELRAADLRFTGEEAAEYLIGAMGLTVSADDVAVLEERTEGWIAALQLAALSLRDRDDVRGFLGEFAGDDRYIVDYLVEEVLARLPASQREFLLRTSVLGRMTAELCDAVTGRSDGRAVLDALDRANLFLVPLDRRRRWYRYHHLFADVLRVHLRAELPAAEPGLHARACEWFEQAGERAEAVSHALAGGDMVRAAELIEPTLPALRRDRRELTMRRWLEALPDDVLRSRPVLAVGRAAALMALGRPAEAESWLATAEQALTSTPASPAPPTPASRHFREAETHICDVRPQDFVGQMVVVDEEAYRSLPSAIALYRAAIALLAGDLPGAAAQARRAIEAAGDDPLGRGSASGILGLALWAEGDLDGGHHWYAEAARSLEAAGHRSDVAGCTIALVDIRLAQGRLDEALAELGQAFRVVAPEGEPPLRGAADLHVALGTVLLERDEIDQARAHLATAEELGDRGGLPQNPYRRRVLAARLSEIDGDPEGALRLLDEAQRHYVGDYFPDVTPIQARRALVEARRGRGTAGEPAELTYLREFEHLALARALVARGEHPSELLDGLAAQAERGGRTGTLIAVLVTRALAEQARGKQAAATEALRRALDLAAPHGHLRAFLDEGPLLVSLLEASGSEYAGTVLGRLSGRHPRATGPAPLSARELDVLRLLGTDLDGPDIARRLFVSVNTVRTHTKNIYAKLGVTSRRAAVRRAAELDLLPRR